MGEMVKLVVAAEEVAAQRPQDRLLHLVKVDQVVKELLLFLGFPQLFLVELMAPLLTASGVAVEEVEDLIIPMVHLHVAQDQELQVKVEIHNRFAELEVVELGALILHAQVALEAMESVLLDI